MKILLNIGTQVITKDVSETISYKDLEAMIAQEEGLELGEFLIAQNGEELDSELLLAECGVESGSILDLALVSEGGKKKKKKKVYKTPKKAHHRHKNVKLRILGYYKVDGETVERAKKVSPYTEKKGVVTYMAEHKVGGRFYCGKSHLAISKTNAAPAKAQAGKGKKGKN